MGWTLDQVRDLDVEDYNELIAWTVRRDEKDDVSMDMDQVIEAKKRKADRDDG